MAESYREIEQGSIVQMLDSYTTRLFELIDQCERASMYLSSLFMSGVAALSAGAVAATILASHFTESSTDFSIGHRIVTMREGFLIFGGSFIAVGGASVAMWIIMTSLQRVRASRFRIRSTAKALDAVVNEATEILYHRGAAETPDPGLALMLKIRIGEARLVLESADLISRRTIWSLGLRSPLYT